MRDWLIKRLGGFTAKELQERIDVCNGRFINTVAQNVKTIEQLQALVPVSAVLPKKRGRPRKYATGA